MTELGELKINLPRFDYMCQGNNYTGSAGDFRYKLYVRELDEIEKRMVLAIYLKNCYSVEKEAGRIEEKEFPYSPEGIDEAEKWTVEKYRKYIEKRSGMEEQNA